MPITPSSQAAGISVTGENTIFGVSVTAIKRVVGIIGTFDPLKTAIVANTPIRVFSAEEVGFLTGFGHPLHRLAKWFFKTGQGIETYIIPQSEAGAAVAAAGSVKYVVTTAVAGTLYLYIGSDIKVTIAVTAAMTPQAMATATVAAITALPSRNGCPVTAAVDGVDDTKVNLTAVSKGVYGNSISLVYNKGVGELAVAPDGVSVTVVNMTGGSGIPDIDDALNALGIGDSQNSLALTGVLHSYGQDSTTLNKLSTYNGVGDLKIGNYAGSVSKPFRSLVGDVATGSAGLNALIAIGDGRKSDRTNGIVPADGSITHPSDLAAVAMGAIEAISATRPEENYLDLPLPDVWPGDVADRWSDSYDSRDAAVQAGISATLVQNGQVTLQNIMSFYHPDEVPAANNAYASMRNLAIVQNVLATVRNEFSSTKWKGISIVSDKKNVTSTTSMLKVRDVGDVRSTLLILAQRMAALGWLFSTEYTIQYFRDNPTAVAIRSNNTGFDANFPLIFSIEGGIFNIAVLYDKSISVLQ